MAKRKRTLGVLGKRKAESSEQVVFTYFDTELRTNPVFSQLDVVDFMETAANFDEKDPRAMPVVKVFLKSVLHEDDFETFWKLAKANGQDVADVMEVARVLVEAVVDRPTGRPSGSSETPQLTDTNSEDDSSLTELIPAV